MLHRPNALIARHRQVTCSQQDSLLVEFLHIEAAERCFERCNGFLIDKNRGEVCHVMYLSEIRILAPSSDDAAASTLPIAALSAMMHASASRPWLRESECPLLHAELPTCPVCLERLDSSVSGLFCADMLPDGDEADRGRYAHSRRIHYCQL